MTKTKTQVEYNSFPKFYDAVMGDMSEKVSFLESLITKHSSDAQSILELGCGTGLILQGLQDDYKVAGIDLSSSMVEIAHKRLPGADIRIGDMSDFDFGEQFDVVLCVFDSINHLLKWEMWAQTFKQTAKHLNEEGLFVFDMNTEAKLKEHASAPTWVREFDDNVMLMKVSEEDDVFSWHIRVFESQGDNTYLMHEDTIHEIAFPRKKIITALEEYFEILEITSKNDQDSDDSERPFFVCKKK